MSDMAEKNELSEGKKLEKELTFHFPHIAKEAPEQVEAASSFARATKNFWMRERPNGNVWRRQWRCLKKPGIRLLM